MPDFVDRVAALKAEAEASGTLTQQERRDAYLASLIEMDEG